MTAATYGIQDEAEQLRESFNPEDKIPEVDPNAKLLQPPVPIMQQESNWPLLTVSKGFMERAMAGAGSASKTASLAVAATDLDDTEAAWGDDAELMLDDGTCMHHVWKYLHFLLPAESPTSNKHSGYICSILLFVDASYIIFNQININ